MKRIWKVEDPEGGMEITATLKISDGRLFLQLNGVDVIWIDQNGILHRCCLGNGSGDHSVVADAKKAGVQLSAKSIYMREEGEDGWTEEHIAEMEERHKEWEKMR